MSDKELIKVRRVAGKQNKKKWRKGIDVSGFLEAVEADNLKKARQEQQPQLIVKTDASIRQPLHP